MNYWDIEYCPFCKNESFAVMPNACRVCENCEYKYAIIKFANQTFSAGFRIGNYKFSVTDKETLIVDMSPDKNTYDTNRIDYSFFITQDNYMSIINKIKSLQPFY